MSATFEPARFGTAVASLWQPARLPVLGPGKPVEKVRPALAALTVETLLAGAAVRDRQAGQACLSALWLWFDFLHESHTISQDLPGAVGSYWHGIMHRREGDFWNSKYWFRQAGRLPAWEDALAAEARELAAPVAEQDPAVHFLATQTRWDASQFVDLCEQVIGSDSPAEQLCRVLQRAEWQHFFTACFTQAGGQLS